MTRPNRRCPERPTEPGILSNVFSFVSREIGEFVVSATGGVGESGPSKRKRGRDGKLQHTHRREGEEKVRQRRGYDGSMIEQWREVSGSDGGDKKHVETTRDRKNDHRGRSERKMEGESRDGKMPRPLSRSPSGEHFYSHTHSQSQSREPTHSRLKRTKAKTNSDGKLRAKSTDGYGRKKDRGPEYQDQPEDADGELTPSTSSDPQSLRQNNHSREGKLRPHLQEEITRSPSPQYPPQDISSSPPPPLDTLSTSPLTSHPISMEAVYPSLRKKPSITMPGSLFPRSDSLEPEPDDNEEERETIVQLLSHNHARNPNLALHSLEPGLDARESEAGPCIYRDTTPVDEIGPSPWRTRPIASVHDALTRFNASGGEERDFSLLVAASPAGHVRPGTTQDKSHDTSRKGKGRAILVDDEDEDLAFILDHYRVQDKEKQLDAARRETGTKSKTTDGGERERDKERIRTLEEEVRMLKEELSRRRRSPPPSQTQTQVPIPPPPPPLPPPPAVRIPLPPHLGENGALFASARAALRSTEASSTASTNDIGRATGGKMRQPTVNVPSEKMAAFLNEMRTVRLRKVGSVPGGLNKCLSDRPTSSDCPGPSGLSRSVSATGVVEGRREVEITRRKSMVAKVPIGSASTSKVGVSKPSSGSAPSNVASGSSKLDSTSIGSQSSSTSKLVAASSNPKPTSTSAVSKSTTSAIAPTSSSDTTDPRISSKRKADVLGESEGGPNSKRRSSTRTQVQSDTSTSSSSGARVSSSSSMRSNFFAGPSTANHSSSSNGTDITTPSLCSDNELGGDADVRIPSTPPDSRHTAPHTTHDCVEIIDVDMDELEPPHRPITPSHPQGDMFKKRPPMSPIPVPTPRKPTAPARTRGKKHISTPERTKRGATPKPKGILLLDEDDDDDGEEEELALPPRLQWKREAKPTATRDVDVDRPANVKGKRRLTLDEELARARSSDRLAELDVESQELVGLGTGSTRRGFLAGGGAGGAPVFMGVGYVRGAEDDSLRQPASRIPRRRT